MKADYVGKPVEKKKHVKADDVGKPVEKRKHVKADDDDDEKLRHVKAVIKGWKQKPPVKVKSLIN